MGSDEQVTESMEATGSALSTVKVKAFASTALSSSITVRVTVYVPSSV